MNHRKLLTLLLLLLLLTGVALAQPGPPRGVEREAPEREAITIEREIVAPGQVNVTKVIPAEADSYIASERPNRNFGADALFLGFNNVGDRFGAQRPLLRFDIAGNIPPGAVVEDARLELRLSFSSPTDDAPMGTVLRSLIEGWNESTVTWNNQPAWGSIYDESAVGSTHDWYDWQITDLVRAWHQDTLANHGVEIIGDEEIQQRERAFYSRETTTAYYPRLVVTYSQTGDTEPPHVTVDPLPTYSPRTFAVSWSGSDQGDPATGIVSYDVRYRVDGGEWTTWLSDVEDTEADFTGEGGLTYHFQARGVDAAGNVEPYGSAEATTTVDSADPVSNVDPLPALTNDSTIVVSWQGDDGGGSGIAYYDVRYRYNDGPWQLWQKQTLATSATFTAPADGLYEFEVRAVDALGNQEPFHGVAEASVLIDSNPPYLEPEIWLPLIMG